MSYRTKTLLFLGLFGCGSTCLASACDRLTLRLNPDWKFIKSDVPGAQQRNFDDRDWSSVSIPHTFNDCDTFDDWSLPGHRGEQNQWAGRTWYRKTFTV